MLAHQPALFSQPSHYACAIVDAPILLLHRRIIINRVIIIAMGASSQLTMSQLAQLKVEEDAHPRHLIVTYTPCVKPG